MSHVNKKPEISANAMKNLIVQEGRDLYQSVRVGSESSDLYRWSKVPKEDSISEDDALETTGSFTLMTLKAINQHMLSHPSYIPTWIDYQTFYNNRARYPQLWNRFVWLSQNAATKANQA